MAATGYLVGVAVCGDCVHCRVGATHGLALSGIFIACSTLLGAPAGRLERQRIVLLAYFCAMTVHTEAHWKLSPAIQEKMAGQNFFPFPILWQLQAFGLLIGAFVVRDARRVAHRSLLRREDVAVSRDIALSTQTTLPLLKLSV